MKLALIQTNPIVGDLDGNSERFAAKVAEAKRRGADAAIGSELCLVGYPPRDLLYRRDFIDANLRAVEALARRCDLPCIVGFVSRADEHNPALEGTPGLHNSAAVIEGGVVTSVHHKTLLPTYDVFDERRYFLPATERTLATIAGEAVGVALCEDFWDKVDWPAELTRSHFDPIAEIAAKQPTIIVNLSASPFAQGKRRRRMDLMVAHAKTHALPIAMVNQVGGNDDLVFDGGSAFVDATGRVRARAAEFTEDIVVVDTNAPGPEDNAQLDEDEATYRALVLGTKDYVNKCGFRSAVLGLSGGIDSALTAVIAADALGPENVLAVALPSRYSSAHSQTDALGLAETLGLQWKNISLEQPFEGFLQCLKQPFADRAQDVTEENLQARARSIILMALSNKFGHLLLSTSNKSEAAVGYSTLYGDMCGGLAVLSDVYKTQVYRLAKLYNQQRGSEVIPSSTLTKPPSAELRAGQLDQDTLPEYDVLDAILEQYINRGTPPSAIVAMGHSKELVADVVQRIRRSEFKRFQAPPGLKVSARSFGPGRRMPLAAITPGI